MRFLVFLVVLLSTAVAHAGDDELRQLYHGARAQAMGGAYVGLADDEEAVFLNPAGLAGNQGMSFHYLPMDLSTSSDLISGVRDGSSAFKNLSGDSLNVVMGKNLYAGGTIAPTLLLRNFALAFLVDQQYALYSQNIAQPKLTFGDQTTDGIQAAYGFALKPGRRKKGELRFGIAAKMMYRRGGYHTLPLTTLLTLSRSQINQLIGNYGTGYGVDLGTQYIYRLKKNFTLSAGLVYTDIGDMNFGVGPDAQKGNMTAGFAAQYTYGNIKFTTTYDYAHILENTDWRKKNHVGLEIALPFVTLYGGIYQVSPSYGASVDIWVIKVTALSYTEELGAFAYQNQRQTYMLRLDFKFTL